MTPLQKSQIAGALLRYVNKFPSLVDAAATLEGIGVPTLQLIKYNNTALLSNATWQRIATQVGFYCGDWHMAETGTHLLLRLLFSDARTHALAYGIAMGAGTGKSFAARQFVRQHPGVIYLCGRTDHNRQSFMDDLLQAAGIPQPENLNEQYKALLTHVGAQPAPMLLIDDAHKLKDRVLHLVQQLFAALKGVTGLVLMGNTTLPQKVGLLTTHHQLFATLGSRFVSQQHLQPNDIEAICKANGVTDANHINAIRLQCRGSLHGIPEMLYARKTERIAA